MIAKAILFKTADKRYGTKLTGDHIGELKQVVVPYTLSLLNIITEGRLDLYRIWKNQSISSALSDFIYDLMKQVNEFILKESPVSHYIEWAKKEECWLKVRSNEWAYNLDEILLMRRILPNATTKAMLATKSRTDGTRRVSYGQSRSLFGKR